MYDWCFFLTNLSSHSPVEPLAWGKNQHVDFLDTTRWNCRHNTLCFRSRQAGSSLSLRWWKIECPFHRTPVLHSCGQVSSRSSQETPVPRISFQKWNSGTADLPRKKISGISTRARERSAGGSFLFCFQFLHLLFYGFKLERKKWKGEKVKKWKGEKVKRLSRMFTITRTMTITANP